MDERLSVYNVNNLFLCNKFLKLQSYSFYLMTSSMDKKETPPYRVSVGYINCESAYRATVSRRRKCRWFWPESWRTSHSRCRHTINPFVASSRSIVSGTFRDTSLKVVPARVERWIFSASNKTKIYLPRLTPLSKLWTKVTQRIVFDNIYFRIDFNAYELFRKINYFSKYEKLWRKTQIRISFWQLFYRDRFVDFNYRLFVEQCPRIILQSEWKFVERLKILRKKI